MGRHLEVPTASMTPEDAVEHFGFLGLLAALDSPVSASITRGLPGWDPSGPTLLEDLEQGHYFRPGNFQRTSGPSSEEWGAREMILIVGDVERMTQPLVQGLSTDHAQYLGGLSGE